MQKKSLIAGIILVIGFAGVMLFVHFNTKKLAYVKVGELYDGFEMKKELENTFSMVEKGRQQEIDSLEALGIDAVVGMALYSGKISG